MVDEDVEEFIQSLDEKSQRIIKDNLAKLSENPYRGEKITYKGNERYRLHIGRTWTAIYDIKDDVLVLEIEDIDSAHKNYG